MVPRRQGLLNWPSAQQSSLDANFSRPSHVILVSWALTCFNYVHNDSLFFIKEAAKETIMQIVRFVFYRGVVG